MLYWLLDILQYLFTNFKTHWKIILTIFFMPAIFYILKLFYKKYEFIQEIETKIKNLFFTVLKNLN